MATDLRYIWSAIGCGQSVRVHLYEYQSKVSYITAIITISRHLLSSVLYQREYILMPPCCVFEITNHKNKTHTHSYKGLSKSKNQQQMRSTSDP